MTGFIYKITNKLNQKSYIGKTEKNVEERWKTHCYDANKGIFNNRPLYSAINKYGKENFQIELIEEVDSDFLTNREIYWINFYNTYKAGYNATLGGEGKCHYNYDEILLLFQQGKSNKEIVKELGCCIGTVVDALKTFGIKSTIDKEKSVEKSSKIVSQYDIESNFIQSFPSCAAAARYLIEERQLNLSMCKGMSAHIGKVIRGERKMAYGFIWK